MKFSLSGIPGCFWILQELLKQGTCLHDSKAHGIGILDKAKESLDCVAIRNFQFSPMSHLHYQNDFVVYHFDFFK